MKVGLIAPLSGFLADYGEEMKKGILSVDAGDIEIIIEDDQCEPNKAVSAFKKLSEIDKVSVIIGPGCGSPQEAIAPMIKNKNIISILPSAASKNLYETSGGKMFNIQYSLEDESEFIAQKLSEKEYKKVLLVSYQNAFSQTHVNSFKNNFFGKIVELNYFSETEDALSSLTKFKGQAFDAIFVTDVTFFFNQGVERLKQLGMNYPVYSQYAVELPSVIPMVGNVSYSFPDNLDEEGAVVKELTKQSMELAVEAIKECGNDNSCIKEYLDKSGEFVDGVSTRGFVLKRIENGKILKD